MLRFDYRTSRRWAWRISFSLALLAWMAFIFYLSSLSYGDMASASAAPSDIVPLFGGDAQIRNVEGHLVLYGVLAWLIRSTFGTWKNTNARQLHWILVCAALAALYGLLDEYHQSFVPHRTASMYDVGLDSLGAAAACLGYWAWGWRPWRKAETAGTLNS